MTDGLDSVFRSLVQLQSLCLKDVITDSAYAPVIEGISALTKLTYLALASKRLSWRGNRADRERVASNDALVGSMLRSLSNFVHLALTGYRVAPSVAEEIVSLTSLTASYWQTWAVTKADACWQIFCEGVSKI